ncbi:MAG: type II toxin-antitoxin system HigB family toxin [Pseudolabrys sp.]|jgi:mRNA interferase HigB
MQVLSLKTLREFWTRHPRAETPLRAWYKIVSAARWAKPNELKKAFGASVDFVGDSRVIFDIGGNKYRLVTRIAYDPYFRVMIKFVGTHEEYDKIDPEKI